LVLDGRNGPEIPIVIRPAAPALFLGDPRHAVAVRPDGSVLSEEAPARSGEIVILFATGLGAVTPPLRPAELATGPAWLTRRSEFHVVIGGFRIADNEILYVGTAPGFAGLYQINLRLPALEQEKPPIRIELGDDVSPDGVSLLARP
jgi:uncharacterized protein (TIGR03437 family)